MSGGWINSNISNLTTLHLPFCPLDFERFSQNLGSHTVFSENYINPQLKHTNLTTVVMCYFLRQAWFKLHGLRAQKSNKGYIVCFSIQPTSDLII